MDIRKNFKHIEKTNSSEFAPPCKKPHLDNVNVMTASTSTVTTVACLSSLSTNTNPVINETALPVRNERCVTAAEDNVLNLDIGHYINNMPLSDNIKYNLITNTLTPSDRYNFKNDVEVGKRPFLGSWLKSHSWLSYSQELKGAFCKHCVIFNSVTKRRLQGAFITTPFIRYKHFAEQIKIHTNTMRHKQAIERSREYINIVENKQKSVVIQLDTTLKESIDKNRQMLFSIISAIKFCGTHDLAFRGSSSTEGNFIDLLNYGAKCGDIILKNHLERSKSNAKYTSVQTQNELIKICGSIVQKNIITDINTAKYFSVLADETADISGVEQMSIGIRYFDAEKVMVMEHFIGFTPLEKLDAEFVSNTIINYIVSAGLDLNYLIGQGYDGCSAMSGIENGVQARIKRQYPKAHYYHCSSHKLNLVVNDLNEVPDIRNSIASLKNCIVFFRESTLRRNLVPNIPLLSETRWTAKYKSIRIFSLHFIEIMNALENLKTDGNNDKTRSKALQLFHSLANSTFLVSLNIIAKYSSILEPITNILQGVQINISDVKKHIQVLCDMFLCHRTNAQEYFNKIWLTIELEHQASQLDLTLVPPRRVGKQMHRNNCESENAEEYYRRSIYVPYIDSIISSLKTRFAENENAGYELMNIHPTILKTLSLDEIECLAALAYDIYQIDNIKEEIHIWVYAWQNSKKTEEEISTLTYTDLLATCGNGYYPAIATILKILLTLPCTTCTVERSFSTLRRLKTWLRSTMGHERLNGLALLSIHRKMLKDDENFDDKVVQVFATNPRRLQFLFT